MSRFSKPFYVQVVNSFTRMAYRLIWWRYKENDNEMVEVLYLPEIKEMSRYQDISYESDVGFYLDNESIQILMDQLWNMGIRPSEHGSPGQMKAVENHLKEEIKTKDRLLTMIERINNGNIK